MKLFTSQHQGRGGFTVALRSTVSGLWPLMSESSSREREFRYIPGSISNAPARSPSHKPLDSSLEVCYPFSFSLFTARVIGSGHLIADHRSLPSPPIPPGPFSMSLAPTMSSSNITVLTQSHAVAAKKRKAKRDEIQDITFNDEARQCVFQHCSFTCLCGTKAQLETLRCVKLLVNF